MYNQTQLSNLTATNNVYTNVTICTLYWASQVALEVKNPPANAGDIKDVRSVPVSGRSSGRGNGNPLQYSCLENLMD